MMMPLNVVIAKDSKKATVNVQQIQARIFSAAMLMDTNLASRMASKLPAQAGIGMMRSVPAGQAGKTSMNRGFRKATLKALKKASALPIRARETSRSLSVDIAKDFGWGLLKVRKPPVNGVTAMIAAIHSGGDQSKLTMTVDLSKGSTKVLIKDMTHVGENLG